MKEKKSPKAGQRAHFVAAAVVAVAALAAVQGEHSDFAIVVAAVFVESYPVVAH